MSDIDQRVRELTDKVWHIGNRLVQFNTKQTEIEEAIKSALQSERDSALEGAAICAGDPKQSHGTRSEIMRAIRALKSQPPTEGSQ